jgi:hypothetical protein
VSVQPGGWANRHTINLLLHQLSQIYDGRVETTKGQNKNNLAKQEAKCLAEKNRLSNFFVALLSGMFFTKQTSAPLSNLLLMSSFRLCHRYWKHGCIFSNYKTLDLVMGLSQELENEESFPISIVTVQMPENTFWLWMERWNNYSSNRRM